MDEFILLLLLSVVCCVAGLWHSFIFIALYSSQSSAVLFTSRHFADDSRSLCSLFLSRNALCSILPSISSCNKTPFLSSFPDHLRFWLPDYILHASFFFTLSRTDVLVTVVLLADL